MKKTSIVRTVTDKKKNRLILFTAIIISILIHYLISYYDKTICVYHDEMTYLSLARSLAKNGTRMDYNVPRPYDNLFYSLLIAPATLIDDVTVQLRVIALINCILLSLGAIPVYLMGRKYLKKESSIWIACGIYLVVSDFAFACSFMRENLYLPFGLWVLYLMGEQIDIIDECRLDKSSVGKSVFTGLMFWLWFFCKRTCFPCLAGLYLYLIGKVVKRLYKHQKVKFRYEPIVTLLIITVSFFVPYFITKYTVFAHDNIDQINARTVFGGFTALMGYYFFIYLVLMILLAYTFFPFIVTFTERNRISSSTRHFFYFIVISLLLTAFWVATNTNVGEDMGQTLPRIHLRYLICFFTPLMICFLAAAENKAEKKTNKAILWLPAGILLWYGYYFLLGDHLLVENKLEDGFCHTQLAFLGLNDTKMQLLYVAVFGIVTMTAFYLYYHGKESYKKVMISLLVGANILNGMTSIYSYWRANNQIDDDSIEIANEVKELIQSDPDANFVILTFTPGYQKLLNTYITEDNVAWLRTSTFENFIDGKSNQNMSWEKAFKWIPVDRLDEYYDWENVDYIIWDNETKTTYDIGNIKDIDFENINNLLSDESNAYDVYGTPMTIDENDGELSHIGKDINVFHLNDSAKVPSISFEFVPVE